MANPNPTSNPPPPPPAGVTGTITLTSAAAAAAAGGDLTGRVHLLPCSIKHTGPCAVSHYFRPRNTDVEIDGLPVQEAFFRGRRLQGTTVAIPDGYRGYVLGKGKSGEGPEGAGDGEFGEWAARAEFGNVTYWNHGSAPSRDDPIMRSFHWFSIADALHKPITPEELASASTTPSQG